MKNSTIAQEWPQITSIVMYKQGVPIDVRYFRERQESDLVPMRSMTKCMTTTLVGLAIEEGYLSGVDQEVCTVFPGIESGITIWHLITMTSGFDVDDSQLDALAKKESNLLNVIFKIPVLPQKTFRYKGTDTHLLSCLMTQTTGENLLQYAIRRLFEPLGIQKWRWLEDSQGNTLGSTGLELCPMDIVKLGLLFLQDGQWEGRALLSPTWIKAATQPQSEGDPRFGQYGYGWFITTFLDKYAYLAAGAGGQFLVNVPELQTTLLVNSDPNEKGVRHTIEILPFLLANV